MPWSLNPDISKTAVLKVTFDGEKPVYYYSTLNTNFNGKPSREILNWGFGKSQNDLYESFGSDTVTSGKYTGTKIPQELVNINKKVSSSTDINDFIKEVKAAGGKVENALYHPDYRKKLDQVKNWGLIPEEKYNSIVGAK